MTPQTDGEKTFQCCRQQQKSAQTINQKTKFQNFAEQNQQARNKADSCCKHFRFSVNQIDFARKKLGQTLGYHDKETQFSTNETPHEEIKHQIH